MIQLIGLTGQLYQLIGFCRIYFSYETKGETIIRPPDNYDLLPDIDICFSLADSRQLFFHQTAANITGYIVNNKLYSKLIPRAISNIPVWLDYKNQTLHNAHTITPYLITVGHDHVMFLIFCFVHSPMQEMSGQNSVILFNEMFHFDFSSNVGGFYPFIEAKGIPIDVFNSRIGYNMKNFEMLRSRIELSTYSYLKAPYTTNCVDYKGIKINSKRSCYTQCMLSYNHQQNQYHPIGIPYFQNDEIPG